MSTVIHNGIIFRGQLKFHDVGIPRPGKDDWGLDTLSREMRGPAHLYGAFMESLAQGQVYNVGDANFFLQSWQPLDHPVFPGVRLSYKGFVNGRIPDRLPANDTVSQTVTVSSDQSSTPLTTWGGLTIDRASRQIQYIAQSTTWRYITDTKPAGPRFGTVDIPRDPMVIQSNITAETSDGKTLNFGGGVAPAALISALTPAIVNITVGPRSQPVVGTPWFECEEQVSRVFESA